MMSFIKRGKQFATVIFCSLFLTGCSFTFVYNNLDWWVDWYLDDYVSLNKSQKKVFDAKFSELHDWHRATQLTAYAKQLTSLMEQVNQGITPEQIAEHLQQMRAHWVNLREHAKPDLIELTSLLNQEQRQDLLEGIAETNRENKEEYEAEYQNLTRDEWVKKECVEQQEQFRKWVGKLNKEQKAQLCVLSEGFQSTYSHWLTYRQAWYQGFSHALSPELNKETYQQLFAELISSPDDLKSKEYVAIQTQNNQNFSDIFYYMMHSLTPKQKNRFNNRLQDYIDDLNDLADD
ncbi:DUF6279 family lipoprotein [Thalassotalea montiporae]